VTRTDSELKGLSGQSPATVVVMPDTSRTAYYCIWEELLSAISWSCQPQIGEGMDVSLVRPRKQENHRRITSHRTNVKKRARAELPRG
jgi:hypothetical protein